MSDFYATFVRDTLREASIRLSMEPLSAFMAIEDEQGNLHSEESGKFVKKAANARERRRLSKMTFEERMAEVRAEIAKEKEAAKPKESRQQMIDRLDRAVYDYRKHGHAEGMRDQKEFNGYRLPQGETAHQSVESAVSDLLPQSTASDPLTLHKAYEAARAKVPDLTIPQFHGVVGRMSVEGKAELRPYTRAYADIEAPEHVIPMHGELLTYVRPPRSVQLAMEDERGNLHSEESGRFVEKKSIAPVFSVGYKKPIADAAKDVVEWAEKLVGHEKTPISRGHAAEKIESVVGHRAQSLLHGFQEWYGEDVLQKIPEYRQFKRAAKEMTVSGYELGFALGDDVAKQKRKAFDDKVLSFRAATFALIRAVEKIDVTLSLETSVGTEPPGPGWTYQGDATWTRPVDLIQEAADLQSDNRPDPTGPNRTQPDPTGPPIAIIGGGPGGLFAAYILNQRMPDAQVTIFEASDRLGGKILTDTFGDGTPFEAGVAELYEYKGRDGQDPLRQLIEEDLGLPTVDVSGGGVVLKDKILRNLDDLEREFGKTVREAVEAFHAKCAELMTVEQYGNRWQPSNDHPWADKTFREVLEEEVGDPLAREYILIAGHSDFATAEWNHSGLNGLKNVLLDNDEYMQLYHVRGGIGRVAEALHRRIKATVKLNCRVAGLAATYNRNDVETKTGYEVMWTDNEQDQYGQFDHVILALPNHWLSQLDWGDDALRDDVNAVLERYDRPAHYLRVTYLFREPWWDRFRLPGDFWMMDILGHGCCCYNESARWQSDKGHVLSFLLAGQDALLMRSANQSDKDVADHLLNELPADWREEARANLLESRVDHYVGSINAQPGGAAPVPDLREQHRPSVDHPGLVIVGDFLFDSTLNGTLMSAWVAVDWLVELVGAKGGKLSLAVAALDPGGGMLSIEDPRGNLHSEETGRFVEKGVDKEYSVVDNASSSKGGKKVKKKSGKIVPTESGGWKFIDAEGTILGYGTYQEVRSFASQFGYVFPETEREHLVNLMTPKERAAMWERYKDVPMRPGALPSVAEATEKLRKIREEKAKKAAGEQA